MAADKTIQQFFNSYTEVTKNKIFAKVPLQIVLKKSEHPELKDTGEFIIVTGVFDICVKEKEECITTPFLFDVNIPKTSVINEDSDTITFEFQPGDEILEAEYKYVQSDVDAVRKILENRVKSLTKSIDQHLLTIWKLLHEGIVTVPLVFVEVWLSELYRDPKDPSRPFRLTGLKDYSKALPVDIKKAIHYRGDILRNIAHGYVKEGIITAVASKNKPQTDIVLNTVLGGEDEEK